MPKSRKKTHPVKPSEPEPIRPATDGQDTVVMFVDIIGASEIANHKTLIEYAEFVTRFQAMFEAVCEEYREKIGRPEDKDYVRSSVRGDEGLVLIIKPNADRLSGDVDAAINIALELKRRWLCGPDNATRVTSWGLLPINLAIGIHVGKTHVEYYAKNNPTVHGYAINFAKRLEGASRTGKFTNIFLSEAAHGSLATLPDERLYIFDDPHIISSQGISRDIRVYEVKHHYLPTDWTDSVDEQPQDEDFDGEKSNSDSEDEQHPLRSRAFLEVRKPDLEVLEACLRINPTNIWIVEEYIRLSMLVLYASLSDERRKDTSNEYKEALQQAERLAHGDQRDAGALFLLGQILGERNSFSEERKKYRDAIQYTDQLAEAHWYVALSYSFQTYRSLNEMVDDKKYDDLSDEQKGWIGKALANFREARSRRSDSAWIAYDHGCEMIQWSQNDKDIAEGIDAIELAVGRLPEVASAIKIEPYLQKYLDQPRIQALIG